MVNPLLDRVLPAELAERNQLIEFKGKVGDFRRLTDIVATDLAAIPVALRPREWQALPVEIRLEFAWLDAGREIPLAKGRVSATVKGLCQRCLEAFDMTLEAPIRMLLVDTDAGGGKFAEMAGSADYEIWELEGETFRPLDMIEEALVMAMPLAPKHESRDSCGPLARDIEDERADTVRPFADLRSQIDRQMEKTNK